MTSTRRTASHSKVLKSCKVVFKKLSLTCRNDIWQSQWQSNILKIIIESYAWGAVCG
jgi:hypothetical protein